MSYVAKISKEGKSISSTEPRDFIFNSAYSTVKIVKEGGGTATVPSSSNVDVSVTHSLNFIPVCMLFTEPTPGSGRWYMGCYYVTSSQEDTYVSPDGTYTYADKDYLKFRIINQKSAEKQVKYYYYIFGDTAE